MQVPANSWRRRFKGGLSKIEITIIRGYPVSIIRKFLGKGEGEGEDKLIRIQFCCIPFISILVHAHSEVGI
jgi:hypothetical protein